MKKIEQLETELKESKFIIASLKLAMNTSLMGSDDIDFFKHCLQKEKSKYNETLNSIQAIKLILT